MTGNTSNTFQNLNNIKSLESLKLGLKLKFEKIFQSQISPENIFSFYNKSLNGLIDIVDESVSEYIKIKQESGPAQELKLVGKELEDEALNYFGIKSVADALDAIQSRDSVIEGIEKEIIQATGISKEVFVPPNDNEKYLINAGSGRGFDEKKLMSRLVTLIYILQNDLGLYLNFKIEDGEVENAKIERAEMDTKQEQEKQEDRGEEIKITRGEVRDNMMRDEPYYKVEVFSKDRVIFICNEEGNASFIFDVAKLEEIKKENLDNQELQSVSLETLNKNTFNYLIRKYPGVGIRIIQSKDWRSDMLLAIDQDIQDPTKEKAGRFDLASSEDNLGEQNENKKPKQEKETKPKSDFSNLENITKKPPGWESVSSLSYLKFSYINLKKLAEQFKESNPDWFKYFEIRGKQALCYSPELVDLLKSKDKEVLRNEHGFETPNKIFESTGISVKKITKFADRFRESNPDWFKEMLSLNRRGAHYSPILVNLVKEYFEGEISLNLQGEKKNSLWESANQIGKILKAKDRTIKKFADQFRESNPDWFRKMKSSGNYVECYAPELVNKIQNHFNSMQQKLIGWESASSLRSVTKSYPLTIKAYAETFRNTNPEYFQQMRTRAKVAEHYSPELVEKIKERFPLR